MEIVRNDRQLIQSKDSLRPHHRVESAGSGRVFGDGIRRHSKGKKAFFHVPRFTVILGFLMAAHEEVAHLSSLEQGGGSFQAGVEMRIRDIGGHFFGSSQHQADGTEIDGIGIGIDP